MTIIYTKQIITMQCYTQIDGENDVVFKINWALLGQENQYSSRIVCATEVAYTGKEPFTPYSNLTEAQVTAWIDEYTSPELMASYEALIAENIEQQKLVVTLSLPWQQTV
jgi:hypothetical protein